MKRGGNKQLLCDVSSVFRLGVLRALMGVSGAGKTTILDVLSGRKTSGYTEEEIKIGGYRKSQETCARLSSYCEQNDIHSPLVTVEESMAFSAWLRLHHRSTRKLNQYGSKPHIYICTHNLIKYPLNHLQCKCYIWHKKSTLKYVVFIVC